MNWMTMGLETEFTIFLAIIGFIIVLIAQMRINRVYRKYSLLKTNKKITGCEVARQILDKNGLSNVYVVEVRGTLTDHYDPRRKVVRLSTGVFHGNTIASVSVAAHEVGHAIQDKEKYVWMNIRSALVPVVSFISYLGYISLLISLIGGITSYLMYSIILILASLLFQLVTLPVEFNASKRALFELKQTGIIDSSELEGSKEVLSAAALTYVASLISTLISLLRLIIMTRDEK